VSRHPENPPGTVNPAPEPPLSPRTDAEQAPPLDFHLGLAGAATPIMVFAAGAAWLGFSGAPDERGLWPILLGALGVGLLLARSASAYSAAALRGMSRPIVMLMVAAWLLAGVFSVVLRESGLVHALVWTGGELGVRGGGFVLMAFLIAVLFSTATGTSLGTILICAPLLYPAAGVLEASPVVLIGAILAGATFGDNVSPVSDTTIASASSQGAPMGGVVRSRLRYALPAGLAAALVLALLGGAEAPVTEASRPVAMLEGNPAALPMLLAPLAAFVMLWRGRGLVESLFAGVAAAVVLALALGLVAPADLVYIDREAFQARGLILDGMEGAVGIVVFTILLMGIVGAAQEAGIPDRLARGPRRTAETVRAAELRIFGVTSLAVLLTTHSVMAILAVGDLVRDSGRRAGIGRFRRANLLDMTVCTYPFLLPFFIPTILAASATASGEAFGIPRVSALEAGFANIYSWALLGVMLAAIWTGLGRSEADTDPAVHEPG
jgi:Na+/H+ antiporter NhaC